MDDQPAPLWPAGPDDNSTLPDEGRQTLGVRRRGRRGWLVAGVVGAAGMVAGGVLGATMITAGVGEDHEQVGTSQVGGQPPTVQSPKAGQHSAPAGERQTSSGDGD